MRMYDIIMKKRKGYELSKEEIDFFVNGFTKGEIPDYQVSALLMTLFFNEMSKSETANLTMSMVNSGDVIDLSKIKGVKVDKHSISAHIQFVHRYNVFREIVTNTGKRPKLTLDGFLRGK